MTRPSTSFLFDQPIDFIERIIVQVEKVIIGKRDVVEKAVIALLGGGHILLEDVPGVGKTMLVRALAQAIGGSFKRIQCTSDLLPSDITGISVYNRKTDEFDYRPGPIMANIVLADELNRTSPKTQSALLEAMEEYRVTVDGIGHPLPRPFTLFATQNPADYEGTFDLPEAQLDRFLLKVRMGYPGPQQEIDMLGRVEQGDMLDRVKPVILPEELLHIQQQVKQVHIDETMKRYIVEVTGATRHHSAILLGASPRASIALMRAAQARAYMQGRTFIVPDDVKSMALAVLSHRLALTHEARMSGRSGDSIIQQVLSGVAVPVFRHAAGK